MTHRISLSTTSVYIVKMPGRGQREVPSHKPKMRRIKAKHQRKRVMRAKDPVLAVFMWGVQHTVS